MYENINEFLENKIDFLKEINKKPRLRDMNFEFQLLSQRKINF